MSVLESFFGPGNDVEIDQLGSNARAMVDPWIERWREGRGPAFLPRTHRGRVYWYGLMDDERQRRELQQLLRHWIGPACSDVVERQGALDPADPFDRDLEALLSQRVVRVEVWPNSGGNGPPEASRETVRDRLAFLASLLDARPVREERTAVSLPALLDQLDLAATSGEAQRADDLLAELERRRLLDAPNTTFARVRVDGLLGRHKHVVAPELLGELDGLRIPAGVVLHVARAAYEVHLRAADMARDADELLRQREALPPGLRHVLRQGASTPERSVAVARAVSVGDEPGMSMLLNKVLPEEPHLQALLGKPLPTVQDEQEIPSRQTTTPRAESPLEELTEATLSSIVLELTSLHHARAHQAVIDIALEVDRLPREAHELIVLSADELDTDAAARNAIIILNRDLGPVDKVEWPTKVIRRVVADLIARVGAERPILDGWEDWFRAVAADVEVTPDVEAGLRDWVPLPPSQLLDLIDLVDDSRPLARVLGSLLAAHDELLSTDQRGELARSALMVLTLSERSDADVRLAARELVVAMLDSGVAASEARDLLDTVLELIRTQLSVGTLTWAIDLMVELTGALAVTAENELVIAWHRFFDLMRVFAPSIGRSRWLEIQTVIQQVDLALPPDLASRLAEDETPDPLACLAGRRVLLYSLRERAARQAAARLQSVGAEVELSTAHVGSPQLAGQVDGSDLVVIVTAAAKHAASEFIEDATRGDPIRVNSTGMSAILAAMESVCAGHQALSA